MAVGGANFKSGATLTIAGAAAGVTLSNVQYDSPTQLDVTINATSAARTGARNLTVTNPDGSSATLTGAFKITAATGGGVSLSSVSPESVTRGTSVTATIKGSGFESGATLSFQGSAAGISLSSVTFVSSTELTATITASTTAIIGPRNLMVTNPDSSTATLDSAFLVSAGASSGPTITGVAPNSIDPGITTLATITGTGFESGAMLSFVGAAAGVTLSQVTVVSSTQITATITVSDRAPAGPRSLTLTNPDSSTATMAAAFEVE